MKKASFIVFCSTLILVVFIGQLAVAGDTSSYARTLFDETRPLLHQTGGIATFDRLPPGVAPFRGDVAPSLSPEEVNKILDKVISNLHKVIELDPNIKEAYYFLGIAYVRKMDRDEAIRAFYGAIGIEPGRETTYILLCDLLWDAKKYEDALKITSRFATQFPQSRVMGATLAGKTYFEMGDFEKALDYGLRIIDLDSSRLEGRILMASSYYCLGNQKAAAEQFKILESDPRTNKEISELKNGLKEKCGELQGGSP
jgi:tetratricopeptide (TPR) repeat protein